MIPVKKKRAAFVYLSFSRPYYYRQHLDISASSLLPYWRDVHNISHCLNK